MSGDTLDLEAVFSSIGSMSIEPQPGGEIDFSMDGVDGFARLTGPQGSVARISFFLASDEDPGVIDDLLRQAVPPLVGELCVVEVDGLYWARLLLEVSTDDGDLKGICRLASDSARVYAQTWFSDEASDPPLSARDALLSAGLAPPPLLFDFGSRVQAIGEWQWGTSLFAREDMENLSLTLARRAAAAADPQFLLCHAGHGMDGHYVCLFVSHGPLAAFVQHRWWSGWSGPIADREMIAATYARLHVLFDGLKGEVGPVRWLLMDASDRGGFSLVNLAKLDAGESIETAAERFPDLSSLFQHAANLFPSCFADDSGSAEW